MAVTGTNISLTLRDAKGTALTHAELDGNQTALKTAIENHAHDDFIPGPPGLDGASIVSADFVADDLVFTKDDAAEITIVGAKTALTGAPGANGNAGASAYDTAVANGFIGDEAAWLATLAGQVGPQGPQGIPGVDGADGTNGIDGTDGADGASIVSAAFVSDDLVFTRDDAIDVTIVGGKTALTGPAGSDGVDGADGASAYEVAVANGFVGTEAAWLLSLKGDTGATGAAGADGADGVDGDMINPMTTAGDIIIGGTAGVPTRLAKGVDGQVLGIVAGVPAYITQSGGGATINQTAPVNLAQSASTNITGTAVIGVSALIDPSYASTYGSGDRTSIITVTHSGGWYRIGDIQLLVNGQTAGGTGQEVGLNPIDNTGCTVVFEFQVPQMVTALKFYTATGYTYGSWVVQGSADNITWSANLCGSTALVPPSVEFDMSANATAYKYYRLLGVGGTIGNRYFHEAEFKIGDNRYITLTPGVDYKVEKSNSSGVQTLTVTRLQAGTASMVIDYI